MVHHSFGLASCIAPKVGDSHWAFIGLRGFNWLQGFRIVCHAFHSLRLLGLARTLHSLDQPNARGLSMADALDGFTVVGRLGTG